MVVVVVVVVVGVVVVVVVVAVVVVVVVDVAIHVSSTLATCWQVDSSLQQQTALAVDAESVAS